MASSSNTGFPDVAALLADTKQPCYPPEQTSQGSGEDANPYAYYDTITLEKIRRVVRNNLPYVCLVETDSDQGTGVVLKGGFLLTNAHLLPNQAKAKEARVSFIRIENEDPFTAEITSKTSPGLRLEPSTFFHHSNQTTPFGTEVHEGALDYAIVAFAPHEFIKQLARSAFSIAHLKEPSTHRTVCVIQHPKILAKRGAHTYGASQWTPGQTGIVSPFSVHHTAQALKSSSGGAIIDLEGNLVALHYLGEISCSCYPSRRECGGGVRLDAIYKDLVSKGPIEKFQTRLEKMQRLPSSIGVDRECKNLLIDLLNITSETPRDSLKRIFLKLTLLIPKIRSDTYYLLRSELFSLLDCSQNLQYEIIQLIEACLKRHSEDESFRVALLHHYAKLISFAEKHEPASNERLHSTASLLLTAKIAMAIGPHLEEIRRNIHVAIRKGDKDQCERLLNTLHRIDTALGKSQGSLPTALIYQEMQDQLLATRPETRDSLLDILNQTREKISESQADKEWISTRYRNQLKIYRENLGDADSFSSFKTYFEATFLRDLFTFLGPLPCDYSIQIYQWEKRLPYSNISLFILIENEEATAYFESLIELLELQLAILGETPGENLLVPKVCRLQSGLYLNPLGNPLKNNLILPPDEMAQSVSRFLKDPFYSRSSQIEHHLLYSKTLSAQGDLFTTFKEHLILSLENTDQRQQTAFSFMQQSVESYQNVWRPNRTHPLHIDRLFYTPLTNALFDLALYYNCPCENPEEALSKLFKAEVFTKPSHRVYTKALHILYSIRLRIQRHNRQGDQLETDFHKEDLYPLQPEDHELLNWINRLVLRPLFSILLKAAYLHRDALITKIDLQAEAIRQACEVPSKEGIILIQEVVESLHESETSLKKHTTYYRLLSIRQDTEPLRDSYLKTLLATENRAVYQKLASIPNRSGLRRSFVEEERNFLRSIGPLLTAAPQSHRFHVKVTLPGLNDQPYYLRKGVIEQLLESDGQVKSQYQTVEDSRAQHRVCAIKWEGAKFHFKQCPYQPAMEYAIHNLLGRLVGEATPPTTLARFEITNGRDTTVYPVQISQTVEGENLSTALNTKSPLDLDNYHLTLSLLAAILVLYGDGHASNYIYKDRKCISVDSDVAFVDPIIRVSDKEQEVKFCSILFLLKKDFILDKQALEDFLTYHPDYILHGWVEDVARQQDAYASLFSPEEISQFYHTGEKGSSFTPYLPMRSGKLAGLYSRFRYLQQQIRAKKDSFSSFMLLDCIKTLGDGEHIESIIGPKVRKAYTTKFTGSPQQILAKVTGQRPNQSVTLVEARKMQLGIETPHEKDLGEEGKFSFEKAKQELLLHVADAEGTVTEASNELRINFSPIQGDLERQEFFLKSLATAYAHSPKPKVVFKNCEVLTSALLAPLLHPGLKVLIISGAPRLTDLNGIKQATELEVLHLHNCKQLISFHLPTGSPGEEEASKYLQLLRLKNFSVRECPTFRAFTLDVFKLNSLTAVAETQQQLNVITIKHALPIGRATTSSKIGILSEPCEELSRALYTTLNHLCAHTHPTELVVDFNNYSTQLLKYLLEGIRRNRSVTVLTLIGNRPEFVSKFIYACRNLEEIHLCSMSLTQLELCSIFFNLKKRPREIHITLRDLLGRDTHYYEPEHVKSFDYFSSDKFKEIKEKARALILSDSSDSDDASEEDIRDTTPPLGHPKGPDQFSLVDFASIDPKQKADSQFALKRLGKFLSHRPKLPYLRISTQFLEEPEIYVLEDQVLLHVWRFTFASFSNFRLGDAEVKEILTLLKDDLSVISLDLSWNRLTPACIDSLISFLRESPPLQFLNIEGNAFGPGEIESLLEVLDDCPHLNHLILDSNNANRETIAPPFQKLFEETNTLVRSFVESCFKNMLSLLPTQTGDLFQELQLYLSQIQSEKYLQLSDWMVEQVKDILVQLASAPNQKYKEKGDLLYMLNELLDGSIDMEEPLQVLQMILESARSLTDSTSLMPSTVEGWVERILADARSLCLQWLPSQTPKDLPDAEQDCLPIRGNVIPSEKFNSLKKAAQALIDLIRSNSQAIYTREYKIGSIEVNRWTREQNITRLEKEIQNATNFVSLAKALINVRAESINLVFGTTIPHGTILWDLHMLFQRMKKTIQEHMQSSLSEIAFSIPVLEANFTPDVHPLFYRLSRQIRLLPLCPFATHYYKRLNAFKKRNYETGIVPGEAFLNAMKGKSSMVSLDLSQSHIGPEIIDTLSLFLKMTPSLQTLDISQNALGPEEVEQLLESISYHPNLSNLTLHTVKKAEVDESHLFLEQLKEAEASISAYMNEFFFNPALSMKKDILDPFEELECYFSHFDASTQKLFTQWMKSQIRRILKQLREIKKDHFDSDTIESICAILNSLEETEQKTTDYLDLLSLLKSIRERAERLSQLTPLSQFTLELWIDRLVADAGELCRPTLAPADSSSTPLTPLKVFPSLPETLSDLFSLIIPDEVFCELKKSLLEMVQQVRDAIASPYYKDYSGIGTVSVHPANRALLLNPLEEAVMSTKDVITLAQTLYKIKSCSKQLTRGTLVHHSILLKKIHEMFNLLKSHFLKHLPPILSEIFYSVSEIEQNFSLEAEKRILFMIAQLKAFPSCPFVEHYSKRLQTLLLRIENRKKPDISSRTSISKHPLLPDSSLSLDKQRQADALFKNVLTSVSKNKYHTTYQVWTQLVRLVGKEDSRTKMIYQQLRKLGKEKEKQKHPENPDSLLREGLRFIRAKNYPKALDAWNRLVGLVGQEDPRAKKLNRQLRTLGKGKAKSSTKVKSKSTSIHTDPTDADALFQEGIRFSQANNLEKTAHIHQQLTDFLGEEDYRTQEIYRKLNSMRSGAASSSSSSSRKNVDLW